MEITIKWFEYSNIETDLDNVMDFMSKLPENFKLFTNPKTSSFKRYLKKFNNRGINSSLFDKALDEAIEELKFDYFKVKRRIKICRMFRKRAFTKKLKKNGLINNSLKLKVNTLNILWEDVVKAVNKSGKKIINFANNKIVKLLRKFFAYLNSLLSSLSKVFSGFDPIKEIKDIIEAYLSIADE